VAGPLIGGALTTNFSWRWCFYINLPFGGLSMVLLALFLKATTPAKAGTTFKAQLAQLDPLGTICFLPSIICLLLALQWGGSTYPWPNPRIIVLFIAFVILLMLFIVIQVLKKEPERATVPTHVFKQRSITAGFLFSLCLGGSTNDLLPLHLLPGYPRRRRAPLRAQYAALPPLNSNFCPHRRFHRLETRLLRPTPYSRPCARSSESGVDYDLLGRNKQGEVDQLSDPLWRRLRGRGSANKCRCADCASKKRTSPLTQRS
jgi:hypothetical protein